MANAPRHFRLGQPVYYENQLWYVARMSLTNIALVRVEHGVMKRKPLSGEWWHTLKAAHELVCGQCEASFLDDNHYLCLVCRRTL